LVSFWNGSQQMKVDVTTGRADHRLDLGPASQDQYCRAWYTTWFGGQLLTAHRGGGIRQWDATWSTLIACRDLPALGHADELQPRGAQDLRPAGRAAVVLYSEQHTNRSAPAA